MPAFPNPGASTNSVKICGKIKNLISSKGKDAICLQICHALYHGYSANLHAAIKGINQDIEDEGGNKSSLSVQKYYNLIFAALCPFTHEVTFKANYANGFLSHLSRSIMTTVKEIMPEWASLTPLHWKTHREWIQQFLTSATTAQGCIANMKTMLSENVQGFNINAFPSQAEETIGSYKKGDDFCPLGKMNIH